MQGGRLAAGRLAVGLADRLAPGEVRHAQAVVDPVDLARGAGARPVVDRLDHRELARRVVVREVERDRVLAFELVFR